MIARPNFPRPAGKPIVEPELEIYITFPAAGGTKSVTAGDLILDFTQGEARLPGGTKEKLSGKLPSKQDFVRSFFCEPDQDVAVSLDGLGYYTIPANSMTGIIFQRYRTAQMKLTATTNLKVFASTDPRGGLVRG